MTGVFPFDALKYFDMLLCILLVYQSYLKQNIMNSDMYMYFAIYFKHLFFGR